MRVGLVPIVAIAVIGKPQLKHFVHFLQRGDGFVDRCQAGGGELFLNLIIYALGAGMTIAKGQDLESLQVAGKLAAEASQLS